MSVRVRRLAASAVVVALGIAALELGGLGYVGSKVRAFAGVPNGTAPQAILDRGIAANGTTALLAAGDIVKCEERPGLKDLLPATAELLGLRSALDPTTASAMETAELAQTFPDIPILALGDTVYSRGSPAEFAHCFEPVWGNLKPRILPTPGNHEYRMPGAFGYYDYFGAQAGPDRKGWYALRAPGWLILSLNSEADAAPGSLQGEWLAGQLSGAEGACVLAFYHKPAHSLADRDKRENAVELFRQLQKGGAALVLNGHNHFYERTAPLDGQGRPVGEKGTVAFTVGTGGRTRDPLPFVAATRTATFGMTGLLKLALGKRHYEWSFISARTKRTLDQGSARCTPITKR